MAIASLKKIYLIGHKTIEEIIVSKLYRLGVMHITDSREILSDSPRSEAKGLKGENFGFQISNLDTEKIGQKETEDKLDKLQYTIKYVEKYIQTQGFLSKLTKGKFVLSKDEFLKILKSFNLEEIYHTVRNLEKDIHNLSNKKARLRIQLFELIPWLEIDVKLDELSSTKKVNIISGIVKERNFSKFKEEIYAKINYSHIQQINTYKKLNYLVLFCINDFKADLIEIFRRYEFVEISYPKIRATPSRIARRINQELKYLEKRENKLREESKKLAKYYVQLMSLYDYYEEVKTKYQVRNYLVLTQDAFCLSGWVISEEVEKIKQKLEQDFKQLEILIFEPGENEQVPVLLKNKKLIQPFEILTNLYGQPYYKELDPTPFLAPFFILFFGLCLSDAGYGLLLMLISGLSLWKFKKGLTETSRRFFKLFLLGGLSTFVCGAMMGGWFGVTVKWHLFDPVKDIIIFFALAFGLGVIQIFTGLAIKMYENIKKVDFTSAIFNQFLWILVITSLIVLAIVKMKILPTHWEMLTKVGMVGGMIGIVLFQGCQADKNVSGWNLYQVLWLVLIGSLTIWILRIMEPAGKYVSYWCIASIVFLGRKNIKNIFGRVGLGLYSLYGISGFFGDILSYSRLVALGLGSGIVGMVINQMASSAKGAPIYISIFLVPLILILGHGFNFSINLLGSFVHPLRLQYVEFFTKFYQAGGKVFKPFHQENKYIYVKEE